jgi:phosphate acetyltransferase
MNTILLIPTGEGVGLTSACLGMIYALDCNGIKAGFLKPFSQEDQEHLTEPLHYLVIYFKVKLFNPFLMKN